MQDHGCQKIPVYFWNMVIYSHVGGNQFYKNRVGVIEIYDQWRKLSLKNYPLLLVGVPPDSSLLNRYKSSAYKESIYFLSKKDDQFIRFAYSGALILIYPSAGRRFWMADC